MLYRWKLILKPCRHSEIHKFYEFISWLYVAPNHPYCHLHIFTCCNKLLRHSVGWSVTWVIGINSRINWPNWFCIQSVESWDWCDLADSAITAATLEETVIPWGAAIWSVSRRFCVSKSSYCSLTRAVTVSLLADLVRLQSLDPNVVFFTQKRLLTLQIAAPHGITVSSNVATVCGQPLTTAIEWTLQFTNYKFMRAQQIFLSRMVTFEQKLFKISYQRYHFYFLTYLLHNYSQERNIIIWIYSSVQCNLQSVYKI